MYRELESVCSEEERQRENVYDYNDRDRVCEYRERRVCIKRESVCRERKIEYREIERDCV